MLVKAFGGEPPRVLHLAPALLLLALYGFYFDPLANALALALSLACACVYVRLRRGTMPVRLAVFLAMLVPLHYAAAGGAMAYVLLCVLFELTAGRRQRLALLLLALGAAVPYLIGVTWLPASPARSLGRPLPFSGLKIVAEEARSLVIKRDTLLAALYAFYSVAGLAAFLAARWSGVRGRLRVPGAVLLAALAGGVCVIHDGGMHSQTAVDYYAYRRMWPEVLPHARKVPFGSRDYLFVNCAVNRALFHTGLLADHMFTFAQNSVGQMLTQDVFPSLALRDRALVMQGDLLLDLGWVNEAEHMACEAMACRGDHPRLLQVMMLCSLARGRTEAARVLLGAVACDPVHGRSARDMLRRMAEDPMLADDPQLRHLRACRVHEDVTGWLSADDVLKGLLARNGRNRMAFYYLMGRYLTYRRLEDFVAEIGRLDELGYERIPWHYEEALLVYAARTGQMPDLGGRTISPRTQQRFEGYGLVLARQRGRSIRARMEAQSDYADTYMFYYAFGISSGPAR